MVNANILVDRTGTVVRNTVYRRHKNIYARKFWQTTLKTIEFVLKLAHFDIFCHWILYFETFFMHYIF